MSDFSIFICEYIVFPLHSFLYRKYITHSHLVSSDRFWTQMSPNPHKLHLLFPLCIVNQKSKLTRRREFNSTNDFQDSKVKNTSSNCWKFWILCMFKIPTLLVVESVELSATNMM
jgi:hypothetical protein